MFQIYGSDECYHCLKLKQMFESLDIDHEYLLVSDSVVGAKFRSLFPDATGIPQVAFNGHPLADYNEVTDKMNEYVSNNMNYGEGEIQ